MHSPSDEYQKTRAMAYRAPETTAGKSINLLLYAWLCMQRSSLGAWKPFMTTIEHRLHALSTLIDSHPKWLLIQRGASFKYIFSSSSLPPQETSWVDSRAGAV